MGLEAYNFLGGYFLAKKVGKNFFGAIGWRTRLGRERARWLCC